jgi:hypothetical protein
VILRLANFTICAVKRKYILVCTSSVSFIRLCQILCDETSSMDYHDTPHEERTSFDQLLRENLG